MIKIISFVDSFKHFNDSIKEFQKRLGKNVELIKLKPSKKKQQNEIIQEESQKLREILEKTKGYRVLLYIEAKQLYTIEFSKLIEDKQVEFADIIFIIGGAYGLNYDVIKDFIDMKLSFSKMTFPHIQAILILYEQIYRVLSIKNGSKYHH